MRGLARRRLFLLDWFVLYLGLCPSGSEHLSLLLPGVAARVRREFAAVRDTPDGRFAELAVFTELLDSTTRGDNLPLAEPLRRRAARLLGRPVPPRPDHECPCLSMTR